MGYEVARPAQGHGEPSRIPMVGDPGTAKSRLDGVVRNKPEGTKARKSDRPMQGSNRPVNDNDMARYEKR